MSRTRKLPAAARRLGFVSLALALGGSAVAGQAQDAEPCEAGASAAATGQPCESQQASERMAPITVSATLNPRPVAAVAADVSVINRRELDRRLVTNPRQLVRYEPGVSVNSSPGRYGQSGFSIRGLGGNRVRIEVDGVPISDSFSFGTMLSSGRNRVDFDSLKRVEIIRGPASSLYGSDALGGVVSFTTKDPADYLDSGRSFAGVLKGQYASVNRGSSESATLAFGNQTHGLMLVATHRNAHQTNNMGRRDSADATRTRPDPQHQVSNNVMAKYVHHAASGRVDRITLGTEHGNNATQLLSARDADTSAMHAKDRSRRTRVSVGQSWQTLDSPLADRIHWQGWAQRSRVRQHSLELRRTGPGYERHVEQSFSQRVLGLQARFFKQLQAGTTQHDLTWGLDFSRTRTSELRDGFAINLATGETGSDTASGNADNYPVRDFPPSDTSNVALFVQDEIALAGGDWRLIPGLRLDRYELSPRADALFDDQPLAEHIKGQTDVHLSPKLGVVWQFAEHFNSYAQYASGFRAPPYADVGMLFSNLRYGYAAIPNPDLQPETSRSLELGLRGHGAIGRFTLAVYRNRYKDFIASQHMIPRSQWPDWASQTPGLALVFQSVNLTRARIRGFEAGGTLYLDAFDDALAGWRVQGSLSGARGDKRDGDDDWSPPGTIHPARAVFGVAYEGYSWGFEMDATSVRRKHRLAGPETFRAPGYTTLDLYAHWAPTAELKLYAGFTNLGNRRYWTWGNLHGGTLGSSTANTDVIGRYTAPGRAAHVALRLTF